MKKLILTFGLCSLALLTFRCNGPREVQKDASGKSAYTNEWKEIDSLADRGLYKSAQPLVEAVLQKSVETNSPGSAAKALRLTVEFDQLLSESAEVSVWPRFNEQISQSHPPTRNVLAAVAANHIWSYFQTHQWQLADRKTSTQSTDIREWPRERFIRETARFYEIALEDPALLHSLRWTEVQSILESDTAVCAPDKTVLDLLAPSAIEFYAANEVNLQSPGQIIHPTDGLLAENDEFIKLSLATTSDSYWDEAIALYQQRTLLHQTGHNEVALAELTIERLEFFRRQNIIQDSEERYQKTLINTKNELKSPMARATISLALATFYEQYGGQQASTTSGKIESYYSRAMELCDEVLQLQDCPPSLCRSCSALQSRIRAKELSVTTEKYVVPGEPWKSVINYRNISECYYSVISFDYQTYQEIMQIRDRREQVRSITSGALLRGFGVRRALDDGGDFRNHRYEVAHKPLESGFYLMIAAPHGNLSFDSTNIAIAPFWVTNISWLHRLDDQHRNEFRFVDRKSGNPIDGVQVQVIGQRYNNYRRKMEMIPGRTYRPDDNGLVAVPHGTTDGRFALHLTHGEEDLWLDHSFFQNPPSPPQEPYTHVRFYTDRKVYRPGQTVHFKGLAIRNNGEEKSIDAGMTETVFLYDVNSQEVDKLKLTTNEFGSYSGTFKIPVTGIPGSYRIESGRGQQYFNVEEYKRPTFKVEMSPIDSAFQLGGNVAASGSAIALAGFPVKNAEVRYRVTRLREQPVWWRTGWPQPGTEREIAAGVTSTDENGHFDVQYSTAKQQALAPNEFYRYTLEVDVTDVSGETRSATQTVRLGEQSLLIGASIPDVLQSEDLSEIGVNTTNLNGEPVHAHVRATLHRLEMPEKPLRSRLYSQPDQIQLDSVEFKSLFPNDVYRFEANIESARAEAEVVSREMNTANGGSVNLKPDKALPAGWYELQLTALDRNGREVKFSRRFTLVGGSDAAEVLPAFLWSYCEPKKALPGEAVDIWISSWVKATVWLEEEIAGEIVNRQRIMLDGGMQKITIPVTEAHRGNFGLHIGTVYNNRSYSDAHLIEVPYSNKKLDVKLVTKRDLLNPGSEETWTFQVSHEEGKEVRTELLAGMYDASLDVLGFENQWSLNPFRSRNIARGWQNGLAFSASGSWQYQRDWFQIESYYQHDPCRIDFGGRQMYRNGVMYMAADESSIGERANPSIEMMEKSGAIEETDKAPRQTSEIPLRSDFNETAFFAPQLRTDKNGTVTFEFTLPESLTTWKWLLLGHSKDLDHGVNQGTVVAQKPLMIIPNAPRFFRQGDTLSYAAKVINKSDSSLAVNGTIAIKDLQTNRDLTKSMITGPIERSMTLAPGEGAALNWDIVVPDYNGILNVEIAAESDRFSDGERRPIPVLSRKMLVTETLPISLAGPKTRTYQWESLLEADESNKTHHALTLEFSANPAWYAVQALPYLMEYPHDCTEQIFSRFYANALAGHIVASKPVIADMLKRYATTNPESLLSNLEKNQELKQLLLEETPWLLASESEAARKKRMALLFELDKMGNDQRVALEKLAQAQLPDGSWPWFKGMRSDWHITQYIVSGLGRLQKVGVDLEDEKVSGMVNKAVRFLDQKFIEVAKDSAFEKSEQINPIFLQYLYSRSLFANHPMGKELKTAMEKFWPSVEKSWTRLNVFSQALLAVAAERFDETDLSGQIVASLNERSLLHEDHGRYWKMTGGAYWYNQKIEAHTMLMEMYRETGAEQAWLDEMKIWLLTQKKVQHWETTTATANACYALLMDGSDWLEIEKWPEIEVGEYEVQYKEGPVGDRTVLVNPEPGTGYFKTVWSAEEITSDMGRVSVTNHHKGPAWGALYWQYFQNMDEVEGAHTTLKIQRELFVVEQKEGKTEYVPLSEKKPSPGDQVIVRMELDSELDLDYVHLSDRRAAGMEPLDARSGFQYREGLGFYLAIRDAANHFFFDRLPKGKHIIEYTLRANLSGDFSSGPSAIQCMYAPEYSAHTRGERIHIK